MGVVRRYAAAAAFVVLSAANVYGFVRVEQQRSDLRIETKRAVVAECKSSNQLKDTIRGFLDGVVQPSLARREGETDQQFAERVQRVDAFREQYERAFSPQLCNRLVP